MKTFLRILLILAVGLAISGLAVWIFNTTGASAAQFPGGEGDGHLPGVGAGWRQQQGGGGPFGGGGQGLHQGGGPFAGMGSGEQEGFREERGIAGGAFAWAETLKNIVVIAILVLAVALIERLVRKLRKPKPVPV